MNIVHSHYSKFNIAFSVMSKNKIKPPKMVKKTIAVCGLRNKFRKGPNIISTSPMTEDMKNLGNRKTFSQKVGIYLIILYV
jgi:hypothetical protein